MAPRPCDATGEPAPSGSHATVDVREMLCAQALAIVSAAMDRVPPGAALAIRYSAEDVKQDLRIWADARGLGWRDGAPGFAHVVRGG